MSRLVEEVKRLSRKLGDIDRRVEKIEEKQPKITVRVLSGGDSSTPEPKFKVGDSVIPHKPKNLEGKTIWLKQMDKYNGKIVTVSGIADNGNLRIDYDGDYWHFSPSWCTKVEEPYFPKKGEYFYAQFKVPYSGFISIYSDIREHYGEQKIFDKATLFLCTNNCYTGDSLLGAVKDIMNIRPATAEEKALLDSKLAEKGLRFDKEKCELVDIPKDKEPVVGEMAIAWNDRKRDCVVGIYYGKAWGLYPHIVHGLGWKNSILFESPEQYKNFLKEK